MTPRCAALSERLSPLERRALAAFIAGRLPAGQLEDELLRARTAECLTLGTPIVPSAGTDLHAGLQVA